MLRMWGSSALLGSMLMWFLVTPVSAICILGMGSCYPTEAEGRQVLERDLPTKILPPYTIQSFKKTNGIDTGTNEYIMEFVAVLSPDDIKCRGSFCPGLMNYSVQVDKANSRLTISGGLIFGKTERGWRGKMMP